MCRKIKKESWYTVPSIVEELEKTLDYKFLDLLVLVDTQSDLSNRLKKIRETTESYSDSFVEQLKSLLKTPNEDLAKELKMKFHPILRAAERPKSTGFCKTIPFRRAKSRVSSSRSALKPVKSEKWTMVTPVPHLKCPCYPTKTYDTKAVTKEDLRLTAMKITDIEFQMATADEKRRRDLMNSLEDYFKSHFEIERVIRDEAGLSEVPSREQPSSVLKMPSILRSGKKISRGTSTFERLSTPRGRLPNPSQIHDAAWDAYKQGAIPLDVVVKTRLAASKWTKKIETKRKIQEKSHSYFFALLTMATHEDVI